MEKHMDDNAELVLREVLKLNTNPIKVFNSLDIIYRRQEKVWPGPGAVQEGLAR